MAFPDEPQGAPTPVSEVVPSAPEPHSGSHGVHEERFHEVTGDVITEGAHSYADDWSSSGHAGGGYQGSAVTAAPPVSGSTPVTSAGGSGVPPKPPEPPSEEDDEEGMARMSFLEHLEELRKRLILALGGIGVSFVLCLLFSDQLWDFVRAPATTVLTNLHVNPPVLRMISPMDGFQIMWMKIPLLFSIFLSSPWVLYQVWAFISPGLYKKEKRYAVPFVVSSAGLFVAGGFFAYFIAFRFGLEFLLSMGLGKGVEPGISLTEYYDVFVDVMLGVGVVFEIPILIFLLTLLHVVSPSFLVRHSRYAILAIVILAAFITPTGDVFNLALFATPMIVLFYVGIFAGYLLVLRREKRRFPWKTFFTWVAIVIFILSVLTALGARYYGYHFVPRWPYFLK